VNPLLRQAPDYLLARGRGADLLAWCHGRGIMPPTLADLENERARRGLIAPRRDSKKAQRSAARRARRQQRQREEAAHA